MCTGFKEDHIRANDGLAHNDTGLGRVAGDDRLEKKERIRELI